MILGLSVTTFTLLHVLISLVGIVSGLWVLLAMLRNDRAAGASCASPAARCCLADGRRWSD